ncbi:MAG: tungstate ABC transporter substrate-binding protein WtpA [Bacteroidales bacterium]|nr:tungstate ABC transporter substrate-binding protein WtpA [Bacteroidales bacterium]
MIRRELRNFGLLLALIFLFFSCHNTENKNNSSQIREYDGELIIFHAGSLSVPFKQIAREFNKIYPNVEIKSESAGSVRCARKIIDLKKDCDVFASADYSVIEKMMIPNYSDWNINFVSNEMVIAFNEKSRFKNEINENNWYNILLKKEVSFGRSDPNSDPCGYRSVLTSKLAEKFYEKPGLSEKLLSKNHRFIRPKEVDLLGLLQVNAIDYIFIYRSVAKQHNLNYIILPDSINLRTKKLKDFYSSVTVKINGKKPGVFITLKGEPMVYGITILKNAPNKNAAFAFVDFLLSEKGMKIMKENGQPSLIPSKSSTYKNIPLGLKKYAEQ